MSDWDRLPSDAGFDSWNDLKLAAHKRADEITAELEAKRAERDAKFEAKMDKQELEWAQSLRRRLAMKPMEPEKGQTKGGMLVMKQLAEMRPHGERAPPDFGEGQRESPVRNGQEARKEMAKKEPAGQDKTPNGQHDHGKQPINGH